MTRGRLAGLLSITMLLCLLPGVAGASTRGYEAIGNPLSGLLILLGLLVAFILLSYAYLLLDRLEQRRIDRMLRENDVDGLIRALRSTWLGQKAARALGTTGDPRAIEPLMDALGDRRESVRKAAAEALGKLGDPRAIEPLSEALNDRFASVRDCARRALESIRKGKGQNSGIAQAR